MPATNQTEPRRGRPSAVPGFLLIAGVLFLMWLAFSDKRDLFHLAAGAGSALAVAALTRDLLAVGLRRTSRGGVAIRYVFSFPWYRLAVFVPWAAWQILEANITVAWMILHPRLPIDPQVVRIRTGLQTDLALTSLATIITLTPGTCVLDIEGDEMVIHVIHSTSASALETEMAEMVEMTRKTFEPHPYDAPVPDAAAPEEI